jgi:hypothetical protein
MRGPPISSPRQSGSALTRLLEPDSGRRRRGWSHLWSHSGTFSRVRVGLNGLPLRGAGCHRTRPIHRPQNSKAREVKASAGSNPAATASLTRPSAGPAVRVVASALSVVLYVN